MNLTSSAKSVSGHDAVGISYNAARTFYRAHSAANAYCRVYNRSSVFDMYSFGRAYPFTDPAGDTGIAASLTCSLSEIPVAALRLDVIVR